MSRQENKKTIGFIIFAIILSVILVVYRWFSLPNI